MPLTPGSKLVLLAGEIAIKLAWNICNEFEMDEGAEKGILQQTIES